MCGVIECSPTIYLIELNYRILSCNLESEKSLDATRPVSYSYLMKSLKFHHFQINRITPVSNKLEMWARGCTSSALISVTNTEDDG